MSNSYSNFFNKSLPFLAIVAPLTWFIAALVWTAGVGHLPGSLFWVSGTEGFIMTLGSPFFAATFIFLGKLIAKEFPKTAIWITILGMLGVCTLCSIASFRLFATVFVQFGIDPETMWKAFDNDSNYYLPFLVLQLSGFLSFIISGIMILRMNGTPKWTGFLLILSIPVLVTGQFMLFHTEIFWPLATGLWTLSLAGLIQNSKKVSLNSQ